MKNTRWTIEFVLEKLKEKGDHITIDESTYVSGRKKARFIDKDYGEFWAEPKNVITNGSDHPKRGKIKKKQTNKEKFGCELYMQSDDFKNKSKKTLQDKYGVDHISKHSETIKKGINTKKDSGKYRMFKGGRLSAEYARDQKTSGYRISVLAQKGFTTEQIQNIIENPKHTDIEMIMSKITGLDHCNSTHPILKYKPDFYIDNIAIECDGLFYHSGVRSKGNKYHFNKRKDYEDINQRVLQFRADEIKSKTEIVSSIVSNTLGKTKNKVFARKTIIREVQHNIAIDFLNKNHLMGELRGVKHLGLYFNDELVTLLSYRKFKEHTKIERFASKIDYIVIGGLSKLIKHIERNYETNEIHSWVDLRYGNGKSLETLGFDMVRETLGFKWTDKNKTFNRLHCRANMDDRGLSENEHAEELKLIRIYDAGQRLYVKKVLSK